jgi:hypothetical protein
MFRCFGSNTTYLLRGVDETLYYIFSTWNYSSVHHYGYTCRGFFLCIGGRLTHLRASTFSGVLTV